MHDFGKNQPFRLGLADSQGQSMFGYLKSQLSSREVSIKKTGPEPMIDPEKYRDGNRIFEFNSNDIASPLPFNYRLVLS